MKRILFYYDNFCGADAKGGTEVATFRIAKALQESGECEVYHCFRRKSSGNKRGIYKDLLKLSKLSSSFKSELAEYIRRNEIDVVVNMGRFFRHKLLNDAAKESGREIKLFFMHHFAPGSEMKKITFRSGLHLLKLNPLNPLYWLRSTVYPVFKLPRALRIKEAYRKVYELSDKVILLSEGYEKNYCDFSGLKDTSKFVAIPNIFEIDFKEKCGADNIRHKRVLILSRMDEIQKRISLALKIWNRVEDMPELKDWHLDIVGAGHNTDIVKRLIKKFNLRRVTYHGWQDPGNFLKKASILMSTSEYEGLPLSLLEAQAYGCVPIAYNSYASLQDIVTDGENGVIVDEFGNIDNYVRKLRNLMVDEAHRESMIAKGLVKSTHFSSKKIADKWLRILT